MSQDQALQRLLTKPDPALLTPRFNQRVPFEQLSQALLSLNRSHGAARAVSGPDRLGRWTVETASGSYQILAKFAPDGQISGLRVPTPPLGAAHFQGTYIFFSFLTFLFILSCVICWSQATLIDWASVVVPGLILGTTMLSVALWIHLSTWIRPVLWAGLLSLIVSVVHATGLPLGLLNFWKALPGLASVLILFPLLIQALRGRQRPSPTVALGRVIEGGRVLVSHGGSTGALNYHMADQHMQYAVDLVGITSIGRRNTGFLPTDPSAYAIYGLSVLAPLSGRVMELQTECPDLRVPQVDSLFPAGNYVVLRCSTPEGGTVYILLAHLQPGSIRVEVGDEVTQGEILGCVGNSGNSTEPHLHLGVYVAPEQDDLLSGEGIPFRIDKRFPTRGTIFNA